MATSDAPDSPPSPRKAPKQKRSQFVVDAIVESCKKILLEFGEKHLTITLLEAVSGIAKGTIYEYFPNLEAVVATLYDQEFRTFVDSGLQDLSNHKNQYSLEEELNFLVESAISWHKHISELCPSFYHQYSLYYDASNRYRALFDDKKLIQEFIAPLLIKRYQLEPDAAQNAASFAMEIFGGLFTATLRFYPETIKAEKFSDNIVSTCIKFLNGTCQ